MIKPARRIHFSYVDKQKLSDNHSLILLEYWLKLFQETERSKLKKMMKLVAQSNSKFKAHISKCNISEMRPEQLVNQIKKATSDQSLLLGFINFFEKLEETKLKEMEKENNKIEQEIGYYTNNKVFMHKEIYQISEAMRCNTYNKIQRNKLTEELEDFEEKNGHFSRISKKSRLMCSIIDQMYVKLFEKIYSKH